MNTILKSNFKSNLKIIIPVVILTILSLLLQYNLSYIIGENPVSQTMSHLIGIIAGIISIILIIYADIFSIKKLIIIIYWILIGLLIFLAINTFVSIPIISKLFIANYNNANGWIKLGPITLQPVEFMKVSLILMLAQINYEYTSNLKNYSWILKKYALYGLTPIFLTFLQPDLGGAVLLSFIVFILFISILKDSRYFFLILGLTLAIILIIFTLIFTEFGNSILLNTHILEAYQLERFDAWVNPFQVSTGYQLTQSLTTIGSAGVFGHGFDSTLLAIPEVESDFIFTGVVGYMGLIGGLIVISCYLWILHSCLSLINKTDNYFLQSILIGIWAMFFLQVFENIGMTLGVLPITGIVLPFLSAGKSAQITFYAAIGLLIAVNNAKSVESEFNYK